MILACAAAYVAARVVSRVGRWVIPAVLVGIAGVLLLVDVGGILADAPLRGPFGYQNATGAFFFQASVAGLMLAVSGPRALAVVGVLAAVGFAAVPLLAGSITAGVLILILPLLVPALRGRGGARAAIVACAGLVAAALIVTTVLGAAYDPAGDRTGGLDRLADATLTERRLVLWSEALDIMGARPVVGVGPGRFERVSPTALSDDDAGWAHHGFLQQGAETGIPGLVLLLLLFLWGFARLWVTRVSDAMVGLGAVALAGLGVHATVDYVLHFAAVPVAAAALVGTATAMATGDRYGK